MKINVDVIKQVETILSNPVTSASDIHACVNIIRSNGGDVNSELDIMLPLISDDTKVMITRCKKIIYKLINGGSNANIDKQLVMTLGRIAIIKLMPEFSAYGPNENDMLLLINYLAGENATEEFKKLYNIVNKLGDK